MKKGFTLAEVLITLGVIGVVAAITLPILTKNYQEKVFVNRLKQTYSMLSQAHLLAITENGDPKYWDLGGNDSSASCLKFANYYKPHLKILKDCGTNNYGGCFYSKGYKALFNNTLKPDQDPTNKLANRARIMLNNGASVAFWTPGSCDNNNICGTMAVDLNGYQPPNKAGVDFFSFRVESNTVLPGSPSSKFPCKYRDTNNTNGILCTKWVIVNGNMDYLRRDISGELEGY